MLTNQHKQSDLNKVGVERIFLNKGYALEVTFSEGQKQIFALDKSLKIITTENNLWKSAQQDVINQAMQRVSSTVSINNHIIIAGTYHFGHLIGDFGHLLKAANFLARKDNEKLLIPPNLSSSLNALINLIVETQHCSILASKEKSSQITLYKLSNCSLLNSASSNPLTSIQAFRESCYSQKCKPVGKLINIFVHSGRLERIANLQELIDKFKMAGIFSVNVNDIDTFDLFNLTRNAPLVISENGSILMNMFLSRSTPYFVLTSPRSKINNSFFYDGGYKYNEYHSGLLTYIYGDMIKANKHPYSDQCHYNFEIIQDSIKEWKNSHYINQ